MARNTYRDDSAFLFELHFRLYHREYGALTAGRVTIRAWAAPWSYRPTGHQRVDAQLLWNGKPICQRGETYCGIPAHQSIDGDYAKECVTSLFCDAGYLRDEEGHNVESELVKWIEKYGDALLCKKVVRFGEES